MNDKIKFGYEDVVDYVLNKMDIENRKRFEEELKFNKELQEFVRDVEAKKDLLLKYDSFEPDDEFYEVTYNKLNNLLKVGVDVKPGRIYLIDTSDLRLNKLEEQVIRDLYFLIIKDPKFSLTGEDVRVIPLSKYVHYARREDLILTEKLISFKKFGVVAHMHLVTNILTSRLKYYVGEISMENFAAILKADLHDYSLVDGKKILSGKDLEQEEDDYTSEQAEVWYNFVYDLVQKLRLEVFEEIETSDEIENIIGVDNYYLKSELFEKETKQSDEGQYLFYHISSKHSLEQNLYEIDEDGFLIVRDKDDRLKKEIGYPEDLFKKNLFRLETRTKKVSIHEIKHLIYKKANNQEMNKYFNVLRKDFNVKELDSKDIPKLKLVAERTKLDYILTNDFVLFNDNKFQLLLSFVDHQTYLTIYFHGEQPPNIIRNFYFIKLSEKSITLISELKVEYNNVYVPFNFKKEEIFSLQNGFIIGFVFNDISVNLHLKLVLQ